MVDTEPIINVFIFQLLKPRAKKLGLGKLCKNVFSLHNLHKSMTVSCLVPKALPTSTAWSTLPGTSSSSWMPTFPIMWAQSLQFSGITSRYNIDVAVVYPGEINVRTDPSFDIKYQRKATSSNCLFHLQNSLNPPKYSVF